MATKFGGFTQEQMKVLLPKLGYKGSMQTDEIDMFLAASPRAASQLGRYTETARQMVEGKPINQMRNMANGGFVFPNTDARGRVNRLNPKDNPEYAENIEQQMAAVNKLQNAFPTPQEQLEQRRFANGGITTLPELMKSQQITATNTPPLPPINYGSVDSPGDPLTLDAVQPNYNTLPADYKIFKGGPRGPGTEQGGPPPLPPVPSKFTLTYEDALKDTKAFDQRARMPYELANRRAALALGPGGVYNIPAGQNPFFEELAPLLPSQPSKRPANIPDWMVPNPDFDPMGKYLTVMRRYTNPVTGETYDGPGSGQYMVDPKIGKDATRYDVTTNEIPRKLIDPQALERQRQPIQKNPNLLEGYYDSPEFQKARNFGGAMTADMGGINPYTGAIGGSSSLASMNVRAYEDYLNRTGNTSYLRGGADYVEPESITKYNQDQAEGRRRFEAQQPNITKDPNPLPEIDGTLGTSIDVTLSPSLQQRVESGDMIDGRTLTPAELEQVKVFSGTMRGGRGTFYNMSLNGKGIILTTEQRRALIADDDARRMAFADSQGLLQSAPIEPNGDNNMEAYRPPQAGAQPPAQAVDDPAATFLNAAQQEYSTALAAQQTARDALAADPSNENLVTALTAADSRVAQSNEAVTQAQDQFKQTSMPTPAELIQQSTVDPLSLVTQGFTQTTDAGQAAAGTIAPGAGQAGATTDAITYSGQAVTAAGPTVTPTSTATATASETGVKEVTSATQASQGQVSSDATVQAAQLTPSQLAQLALTPSQIAQAAQVQTPPSRNLAGGELVTGSAVDMETVKANTNFAAATGAPSTDATIQGQLTQLMADFEGGDPPTWAAGAMRAATAAMAQRGLGASSMAGQAIVQAAMEAALPIAQMDASTFARFEEQNLSNRQQTAMFAAEKRAQFLGVEFNQEFQTRVANAARVSDIANVNFNAQQQVALENAQLTQSVDLANLNASNAKVMADAAALSQTDLTNLNNRQQAQVQNAKSFLDMEMSNLSNSQQMELFKSQAVVNSLMSDTAAANATAQFNASSENQVNQFFSNLATQISQFNGEQQNSLIKFNVGQANAIEEFNATQVNFRDQFNAQNKLIIDQANAQWYQNISTTDNAAINQSNREAAAQANNMSSLGFSAYMQEVRDLMSFAWQTANNDADRATTLATASLAKEANEATAKANKSAGLWGALGSVAAAILKPIG